MYYSAEPPWGPCSSHHPSLQNHCDTELVTHKHHNPQKIGNKKSEKHFSKLNLEDTIFFTVYNEQQETTFQSIVSSSGTSLYFQPMYLIVYNTLTFLCLTNTQKSNISKSKTIILIPNIFFLLNSQSNWWPFIHNYHNWRYNCHCLQMTYRNHRNTEFRSCSYGAELQDIQWPVMTVSPIGVPLCTLVTILPT